MGWTLSWTAVYKLTHLDVSDISISSQGFEPEVILPKKSVSIHKCSQVTDVYRILAAGVSVFLISSCDFLSFLSLVHLFAFRQAEVVIGTARRSERSGLELVAFVSVSSFDLGLSISKEQRVLCVDDFVDFKLIYENVKTKRWFSPVCIDLMSHRCCTYHAWVIAIVSKRIGSPKGMCDCFIICPIFHHIVCGFGTQITLVVAETKRPLDCEVWREYLRPLCSSRRCSPGVSRAADIVGISPKTAGWRNPFGKRRRRSREKCSK